VRIESNGSLMPAAFVPDDGMRRAARRRVPGQPALPPGATRPAPASGFRFPGRSTAPLRATLARFTSN